MRKYLLFLLTAVCLLLVACGKKEGSSDDKSLESLAETKEQTVEQTTEAPKYTLNSDVIIDGQVISGTKKQIMIMFKTCGEKAIKSIECVSVLYDSNKMTVSDKYVTKEYTDVNWLPDKEKPYMFVYDTAVEYVDVAISKVYYDDGTVWELQDVDAWYEDCIKDKSTDKYEVLEKSIKKYVDKSESFISENNIDISLEVVKGNSGYDIIVTLTNNSDKDIAEILVNASLFNAAGRSVSPESLYTSSAFKSKYPNFSILMVGKDKISAGQTITYRNNNVMNSDGVALPAIDSITYSDGSKVANANVYVWHFYNTKKR